MARTIRMVGIGSIIASPSSGGRFHAVTDVRKLASSADGTLSLVRSRAVGKPAAGGGATSANQQPVTGQGAIRLVDPRLLLQLRQVEPLDPQAEAIAAGVAEGDFAETSPDAAADPVDLSPAEQRAVDRLRQIDGAIRQEERAHAANAGQFASAPQYTTITGPDGRQYAIAGQVDVRASNPSGDPRQAERALNILSNAALSPNAPSAQDHIAARSFGAAAGRVAEAYAKPGEQSVRPGAFDFES